MLHLLKAYMALSDREKWAVFLVARGRVEELSTEVLEKVREFFALCMAYSKDFEKDVEACFSDVESDLISR